MDLRNLRTAGVGRVAIPMLAVCICTLVGCGAYISFGVPPSVLDGLPNPSATSTAQYHAYGDSITFGLRLVGRQRPYPSFVAEYEKVTFVNNAISGAEACDVATSQIFPNEDSPTLATHPTYTLLIGTNDVDIKGAGSYEAVFTLCHQAAISWLGIPAEHKVLATGKGVSTSGNGVIDSSNNWNAWTSGERGASISFTITTSENGPIYAWPRIFDGNPGTYTYSLDGIVMG